MDFFEAQARAKKRTSRLLVLFGVAVAGTIAAAYFAAILILHFLNDGNREQRARYGDYDPRAAAISLMPEMEMLSVYLVVVAALIFKPAGLFGKATA